eukprot:403373969
MGACCSNQTTTIHEEILVDITSEEIFKKYFELLELTYEDGQEITIEFINQIARRHVEVFPYQNVHMLMNEAKPLDLSRKAIYHRMLIRQLGGCSYEHVLLFSYVMQQILRPSCLLRVMAWRGSLPDDQLDTKQPTDHCLVIIKVGDNHVLIDLANTYNQVSTALVIKTLNEKEQVHHVYDHEKYKTAIVANKIELHREIEGEWNLMYTIAFPLQKLKDDDIINQYNAFMQQTGSVELRDNLIMIGKLSNDHSRVQFHFNLQEQKGFYRLFGEEQLKQDETYKSYNQFKKQVEKKFDSAIILPDLRLLKVQN